jgi:hypothetical protein
VQHRAGVTPDGAGALVDLIPGPSQVIDLDVGDVDVVMDHQHTGHGPAPFM